MEDEYVNRCFGHDDNEGHKVQFGKHSRYF